MNLKDNKIGIYEKAIPNSFNWETKIKVAKAAGYDFIEISVDESDDRLSRLEWTKEERNNLLSLFKKNDLQFESMCLSGHRRFPFGSKNEKTREKAYRIMDQAIELALDLEIKNIQLAGYDVYYEESDEETIKLLIEGLRYASKQAEIAGVMLTLEIMDTWLMGTISRALKYVKIVNSPNLNIYPDLGNLSRWCEDPEDELIKGINYIEAIHLKDTLPGVFKCVPFGNGTVRFSDLFNTLKDLKYSKPFLIEMWTNNTKKYTFDQSVSKILKAKTWLYNRM